MTTEDDLGITRVDGLGKKDLDRVRSLALIDLTALFDMYGITYVRHKAKGRGRGRFFRLFVIGDAQIVLFSTNNESLGHSAINDI